jgi:hypothetical protein
VDMIILLCGRERVRGVRWKGGAHTRCGRTHELGEPAVVLGDLGSMKSWCSAFRQY